MLTLSLTRILTDGLLLSLSLGTLIIGSFLVNPRMWLQDYPAEVRAQVPPLTKAEKREQGIVGMLFFFVTVGILFFSNAQLKAESGGTITFLSAFVNTYFVFTVFNLFDLIVLDFFLLGVIKPKFLVLPGAESLAHTYQSFDFHLKSFWKALLIGVVVSVIMALIAIL